jgi:HlyD family secretion protein
MEHLVQQVKAEERMDRPVDRSVTRRKWAKRTAISLATLIALSGLFAWGPGFISPTLSRNRIRTDMVRVGPIESTITASGTVVPEFEEVLAAPIDARVVRIGKKPGDMVRRGETIVEFDLSDSLSAVKTIEDRLAIKENEQRQLRINLDNTLIELKSQQEIRSLEVRSLEIQRDQNRKLRAESLISDEDLRKAEVQLERAIIELKSIEESIANAEKSTGAQLAGRELEMSILKQEKQDKERLLRLATAQSDRDGILTWVVQEVGSVIRQGQVIARIADLSSFRVEANLSDVHASRLSAGMPVRVRLSDSLLDGSITSILPTIKDGVMTVVVTLKEKSDPRLRSNLRVDVYIVSGHKDKAMKIKRGPAVPGEGNHHVFVIREDVAVKTPVSIGISSFEEAEVVTGVLEGDEVVISDMADHAHRKEIRVR